MAMEQVAGISSDQNGEEIAILRLVKGIVLLRDCVAISISGNKERVVFQRYNGLGTHDGSFSR